VCPCTRPEAKIAETRMRNFSMGIHAEEGQKAQPPSCSSPSSLLKTGLRDVLCDVCVMMNHLMMSRKIFFLGFFF